MYIHMYRVLYGLMRQQEHDDVLHILYVSAWHKGLLYKFYHTTCSSVDNQKYSSKMWIFILLAVRGAVIIKQSTS